MADQPSEQQTSALFNTTMQQRNHHQQQPRQDKGLLHVEVPSGGCSQSSSSSSLTSLPSLKDQLLANEQAQQQDYTALSPPTERHDLEQQERGSPSMQNVVVGVVEIEQSLNDTVLPAAATATGRRSSRRRRRGSSSSSSSNGQRALTTESHPFFDGTLEALIQQAERDDDMDDSALLASMDRLRVVDTSIRRTTRRGGRRPARRNGGRAARSA